MCCVLEYTIAAIFRKVLKKILIFDKFKKWFFLNNFFKQSSVTYFIAYYSLLNSALETYCYSSRVDGPDGQKRCWKSVMKFFTLFFAFFWQFPVVTDIQYTYQNKAFFKVYNFCIYITINIWHHETFFSLSLQNQGTSLFLTRISLEPYIFSSCVLFLWKA